MRRAVVLGGGLLVSREDRAAALSTLGTLRARNPAHTSWVKRQARGERAGPEPEPWLACGGDIAEGPGSAWDGGVWLPRFAPVDATGAVDRRVMPEAAPVSLGIDLRDYQREALAAWVAAGHEGTIVAPCGAGKTAIGLAAVATLATPALVLVHTLDLATQWMERIAGEGAQLVGTEAGLVGDGKRQDGARVVVATMQTLARWGWWERYAWGKRFGLVIVDEAHHAPAGTFADVLSTLPGRARLGLTATPARHDGLTDWVWWCCGPEVYRIEQRDLEMAGAVLTPDVRWVETGWDAPRAAKGWTDIVAAMCEDARRNRLITSLVSERVRQGRSVLVLSDRVEHCHALAGLVDESCGAGSAEALVGAVSKKRRESLLERAQSGELRCVTATSVADEGLDLPRLDTVVLAAPSRNLGRVQQRVGRALRRMDGKARPCVLDLVDAWGPFQGFAWKRWRLYRDLGWDPAPPVAREEAA